MHGKPGGPSKNSGRPAVENTMKHLMLIPVFCFFFQISGSHASSLDNMDLSNGCGKAIHAFWKARFAQDETQAILHYQEAIESCPGFIRPYELAGNLYRKENQNDKAIGYFINAAELGTTNHKLYYWLAYLLVEKGDLDEANRYIKKSLSIRPDYSKAIKLASEIENALDKEGPTIILYEPSTPRGFKVVHPHQNLTVRGIATDKSGLAWVKVNKIETSPDEYGNFLKDVPIHLGKNAIQVEAADSLGNRSQISIDVEGEEYAFPQLTRIESGSQTKALYAKSFAVVIGINQYEKWPVLEFAAADAKAVKAALENSGFDEIVMIMDQEASQRRILTELFHNLPAKVSRNDRVLFYFAGHGQTEDLPRGGKKGYIIPADAETDAFASTAVSMEQIRSLSSRIAAKHILYVMDCCYSGLGLNRSAGVWPGISDFLRKVASMRVVQIITAGGQGEQVQERGGHGLFTSYFLKAIAGEADLDKDNVVTGTELGAYLRPIVSNASRQAQTPLFGRLEGEGEFLFFVKKVK
jgi:tetratricopeptide (TPR) repeat protein